MQILILADTSPSRLAPSMSLHIDWCSWQLQSTGCKKNHPEVFQIINNTMNYRSTMHFLGMRSAKTPYLSNGIPGRHGHNVRTWHHPRAWAFKLGFDAIYHFGELDAKIHSWISFALNAMSRVCIQQDGCITTLHSHKAMKVTSPQ